MMTALERVKEETCWCRCFSPFVMTFTRPIQNFLDLAASTRKYRRHIQRSSDVDTIQSAIICWCLFRSVVKHRASLNFVFHQGKEGKKLHLKLLTRLPSCPSPLDVLLFFFPVVKMEPDRTRVVKRMKQKNSSNRNLTFFLLYIFHPLPVEDGNTFSLWCLNKK